MRGLGGGEKQQVRIVDYDRKDLEGVVGVIQRLEHDPNRSGFLALVRYERGDWIPSDSIRRPSSL